MLRQSYNVDFGYRYCGCIFVPLCYACGSRTVHSARWNKYVATTPITSYNDICNRSQHCNFGKEQAERSLMIVYVNRNMLEQLL